MTINARTNERGRLYRVKLNGKDEPNAFYADGRRGVIREYRTTENGNKYLQLDGTLATREVRGKVKWIRIR